MALDFRTIRGRLVDHALTTGLFDSFNGHPPDVVPGTGTHGVVEFVRMRRARGRAGSGLASTSLLVVMAVSVYLSMDQEPADDIDPRVVDAAGALFAAYLGDFELGGDVRNVDVAGSQGVEMDAVAGYARVGGVDVRAATITLPIIVNDVYDEAP